MANKFLTDIELDAGLKDNSNGLGTSGQVLSSTGTGVSWIDSTSETAERTEILVKNVEGSALVKGDPIYIVGGVGASARLEVGLCDSSDSSKMPCVGLLSQNLANNGEGLAIVTGKLRNLITSPIDGVTPSENDTIYVKPGGSSGAALTTTKPTANNHLIQNVGQVGLVSTTASGNLVVSAIMRTNDVPNQIDRNVNFTDNSKLTFGDSTTPDLQIYHDGSNSYINEVGTGVLSIQSDGTEVQINKGSSEYMARFITDAGVKLYYDNFLKFETTSTGISVTGGASFTDNIDINGNNKHIRFIDTYGNWLIEAGDGANNFKIHSQRLAADYLTLEGGGQLNLGEYGSGTFTGTATYRLAVDSSGDVIEIPIGDGAVDGSGTANYVTKWSDTDTITNSIIYDNGTNVGIGTTSPLTAFEVIGTDPNNNVSRVVNIKDDRSYAANVGGGISFFGKYNSSNGYSTYGQIIGGKTNATDGDYSGYLSFFRRTGTDSRGSAKLTSLMQADNAI